MDIFRMAGVSWNEAAGLEMKPLFQVQLVSLDGKPVKYSGGIEITPECSVDDVDSPDMIIVPSSGYRVEDIKNYSKKLSGWLRVHGDRGVDMAGFCTGVFLLAEAGLLKNKMATTHWGYASLFRKKYPDVDFRPERLITHDGTIYCSGGGSAGIDLCLFIIENYYDAETANQCAKVLLLERGREVQTPYEVFRFRKKHQDPEILKAQAWIESCFTGTIVIEDVATHVGMSARNFKRRFKIATGDTPIVYIQKLRIEAAKKALEFETDRIDDIAAIVGYDDIGFFRKLFVRHTGISPTDYRQKYNQQRKKAS
jgi:transcriptional regulator GlxA family with amidase domain